MLNIAIVDDLRDDRERLKRDIEAYCAASGACAVCKAFPSADALLSEGESDFRIAFLDICMEGLNGIELARRLRRESADMLIVFVSTSREYAFDAFPLHPFDYLIKPYAEGDLRRVLDEAMRVLDAGEAEVEIRVPHASMQVPLRQIVAVVASDHALEIVLTDGRRLRGTTTFSGLCRQLESDGRFLLLNRGGLVNMDEVLSLQQDAMRMKTGDMFPIRTRGRGELISRFTQYQIARMRRGSHS